MITTFTTPAYADITMFGDVAERLIKIMGYSITQQGVIRADELPRVIERLKEGIDANYLPQEKRGDADEGELPVSLVHRAMPLIDLLMAAAKANADVMWSST